MNNTTLFTYSILDSKDELDEKLERCHSLVMGTISELNERMGMDALQSLITKGQHDEIQMGLLYNILIDPKSAAKNYRDMTLLSQDGLAKVVTTTTQIVFEKWIKLSDLSRTQLTWLTRVLVKNGIARTDTICHQLLRQIAGGDISQRNFWLAETMLDIFSENKLWLDKNHQFMPIALYTYLRVIIDHGVPHLLDLRQREVTFCATLLREKWSECLLIGRDLVRLLQGVARIPEFKQLWDDILINPTSLHPTFTGLKQLMQIKTSKLYFISRLTPDMEAKLVFLTLQVRFGQHKKYQEWFQRQYLSTSESQSLRCDLIRYICTVIHPPNQILCSDIIPRWAVIGWLLTTCTSNVAASNAKLALFYDWLFFDPEKDNIMNIEPCILVMFNSMRPHPAITATLLDFMCRIMSNFHPSLINQVKNGIFSSLHCILEKRVLQSLQPLFDGEKLDGELYSMLIENFSEFITGQLNNGSQSVESKEDKIENSESFEISPDAAFSDEEEPPLDKMKGFNYTPIESKIPTDRVESNLILEPKVFKKIDLEVYLNCLDDDIKELLVSLQQEIDKESQCEIVENILQKVTAGDFEKEDCSPLATCFCQIFNFSLNLLPSHFDEEALDESISSPVFVIFRTIQQVSIEDKNRPMLLSLLDEMYKKQPKIGYYFLYFLKASSKMQHEVRMSPYTDFCKSVSPHLETFILNDMTVCRDDDIQLFTFLIPEISSQFSAVLDGNIEFILLIVSSIDASQLQELICKVLQGNLNLLSSSTILKILEASLSWETIEQFFLWQLVNAHDVTLDSIIPLITKLNFIAHAEAVTSLMILLKQECPTSDLLRLLLCRVCSEDDLFCVSILKTWATDSPDKLATLLYNQLTESTTTPSKKRQRNQQSLKIRDQPSVQQVLAHLDHFRLACKDISFLSHEQIQQALQSLQSTCSEAVKVKYGDLLALVEDVDEVRPASTRVLRQVPGRRALQAANKSQPKSKSQNENWQSSSESSEEEDNAPKYKKPKRIIVIDD